jgi:hypothetical protein
MGYKTTGEPWVYIYSQTIKKMPFKMGLPLKKQPKPENYRTTINRFKQKLKHQSNHFCWFANFEK